jgi:hypothetical protein
MHICWLSYSSIFTKGGSWLTQGEWAGHHFDIVSKMIVAEREMAE